MLQNCCFLGTVDSEPAWGTPMIYTTNDPKDPTYNALNDNNKLGPNHWMVELQIDCNTVPTFYVKVYY